MSSYEDQLATESFSVIVSPENGDEFNICSWKMTQSALDFKLQTSITKCTIIQIRFCLGKKVPFFK